LIPLLVPFLAALWLGTGSLEQSLKQQTEAKLRLAGHEWATVSMNGRDARIEGEAETEEEKATAIATVAGQYGIRRVASAINVIPRVVLDVPTVATLVTNDPKLPITGSWQEGTAKVLTVGLGGRTYILGRDPELTSSSGKWSLKLATPLADGTYDVAVEIGDGRKARAVDSTTAELVLDTTPPEAPTAVSAVSLPLTGTWDEGHAKSLEVTIAGKTYVLGTDGALSTDGQGNWKLALTDSFAAGSYDVAVRTADEFGNVSSDASGSELVIAPDVAPPPSPTITPFAGMASPSELAGTWPEGDAVFLAITLNNQSYIFGSDQTLRSDGNGNWRLALAEPLPKGVYDVAITTSDSSGNRSFDLTRDEIQVKGNPAPEPVEPAAQQTTTGQPAAQQATTVPPAAQQATTVPPATPPAPAAQPAPQPAQPSEPPPAVVGPAGATPPAPAPEPAPAQQSALLQPAPQLPTPLELTSPAPETQVAAVTEPPFDFETDANVNRKCQTEIDQAMAGHYIFFLSDGDTIAPESLDLLKKVAKAAGKCPKSKLEIAGHTDATGSPTHNLELSQRRAGSVLEALVGSGLTRARLTAVGYGESKPAATNKTPEGRAINRRIEFMVAQ
jgi:outer membrane protein OmpA-like peptidoglycan-associated protein